MEVTHIVIGAILAFVIVAGGIYVNGFINSLLGQKDVTITTEGYNYLAMNDDVYMYTGITSVVSDESNIGFILSNQRTKETRFYSVAGAEEYSAIHARKHAHNMKRDWNENKTMYED